ncbi:MAG TPA: glutamate-1-semialdehyde 2,1-aminomutase [Chitinophagales bacterium]|nr:glutamate-1-semialdehyde 2,1-aminomutase [Chitinophagales bacterium]HNA58079.1 glutamate-1-semialdehyde 2,1-aminomutase [Chitinophagales bacterium]HNE45309.1 glutamate-1-semialdehyde 2,1-aminomutase [Chitinophagales bacterium]HNF69964.1 glutamate-1-semialdehyde 2,1-aminomutase [Chitinophagales bacterium]HNJ88499.1 glutamate-1-semialdehyde 2,1-aminomutase [Chitinophagales bacterium]
MIARDKSTALFEEAKTLFPGGVSSPVRAFRSVEGAPLFMQRGEGALVWDEDGNQFIDYCCSWGPLILGHADKRVTQAVQEALVKGTSFGTPTRYENIMGQLIINNHRFIEKLRFVSSGTEAVMSAIRLARGYTGRNKIIKFEGCYHGHSDALLVKAGSGLVTLGETSSKGVPAAFANETIVVELDDEAAISSAIEQYPNDIACIIIEPVPANNGLLLQRKEYLQFLRNICDKHNIILLFDEVISGFRLGFEGASGLYNIQPDLITFGKIIGGGLPVGAYGGKKEIMGMVSPDGPVYQAGTLSGNPLSISAGIAQLQACLTSGFYEELHRKCRIIADKVNRFTAEAKLPFNILTTGSIFWLNFTEDCVIRKASDIKSTMPALFKPFHRYLLEHGIYIGPSGYEVCFVSAAHTDEQLEQTADIIMQAITHTFQK